MMNKLFDTKNLTHEDVQQMLSLEDGSLTAAESIALEEHLAGCEECTQFAQTVALFKQTEAVAYAKQTLTLTEKAEIVRQIDLKLDGPVRTASESRLLNRMASGAVALMATLIIGAFLFTISRPQQTTIDVISDENIEQPLNEAGIADQIDLADEEQPDRDYDGWELGVAFDIPDEWSKSQLVVEELNGDGIVLAMGNEIHDLAENSPPLLEVEETFGFVLVDNPGFKWAGSPAEQLEQFHRAGPGGGRWFEIAGRFVLVSEDQMRDNATGVLIHTINGSLQIGGRFVRITIFGRFADEEDKAELTRLLNEIVESTIPVDYIGWQIWSKSNQEFYITHPTTLQPDEGNSGGIVFEQVVPNLPFRYLIDHNRQVTSGDSLDSRLESLLESFEETIPIEEPWSPAHRPDLVFGRYHLPHSEKLSLLVGVLENPDLSSEQPHILAWLLLENDAVDTYQDQFERILRSVRWQAVPLFPSFIPSDKTGQKVRRSVVEEFQLPDSDVGSGLNLYWVEWSGSKFQPSDEIELTFEWQTIKPIDKEYDLFIHLLNDEGELVAQLDSEPVINLKPTHTWPLWELAVGQHSLQLPDDLPAGDYSLVIGHYDVETGERLRISGNDSLELGLITISGSEAVEQPSAESTAKTSQFYDGWELGITFNIPVDFGSQHQVYYQDWNGGQSIALGQDIVVRSASFPLSLAEGEMAGLVFVADAEVDASKSADDQLMEFHTSRVGDAVSMELAGQSALISKREVIEGNLPMYAVDISLIFNGRFVQVYGIGNFGGKDDSDPIVRALAEIIGSMEPVDYADWFETIHPAGGVSFLRPDFTQQVRLLKNTAIYSEAESSSEPFLLYIDYEQVSSAEKTLPDQIDRFLVDYGETILAESFESPAGRSDILLRRYDFVQADDVTLLVGALKDPKVDFGRPFVVVGLYISQEEIDQYLPLFEQVLRSMRWQDEQSDIGTP